MAIKPKEREARTKVKTRTGVDLDKYRTDVISDSVVGLIDSPFTLMLNLVFWPILGVLIFWVTGYYFIWSIGWMVFILWILLGTIMGAITGFAWGSFFAAWSIADSSKNLYEATLDTMDVITEDLRDNRTDMPEDQPLPTYKEWLRIIHLAIVVPIIREVIRQKLWPIGDWVGNMTVKALTSKTDRSLAQTAAPVIEGQELRRYTPDELQEYCNKLLARTQKIRKQSAAIHKTSTWLTVAPLRVIAIVVSVLDIVVFGGLLYW